MKTSILTGADLNCAVVMAIGYEAQRFQSSNGPRYAYYDNENPCWQTIPNYANDWVAAGMIIEQNHIDLRHMPGDDYWEAVMWLTDGRVERCAASLLIAAMRCFVASVYGDDIDLPT